jgi:hypothetical protein
MSALGTNGWYPIPAPAQRLHDVPASLPPVAGTENAVPHRIPPPHGRAARHVDRKTFLDIPWRDAEALQAHLRRAGIRSTVCWDPAARQAKLELPAGTDLDQVHHAILDWLG